MLSIGIIVGSTRPGRVGEAVARWIYDLTQKRGDASFELVDIRDFQLPLLDEPLSAFGTMIMKREYTQPHTNAWAEKIASFDGFVFVTPEYNHGPSGALKNALDYLYREWNNKAAGFVGYGVTGAARAIEHLRLILSELQVATVRNEVNLSIHSDFENYRDFKPAPMHLQRVEAMLDQLIAWSGAMQALRQSRPSS